MTIGQKAQSKSDLLLQLLATFVANGQKPNGSDPNCAQVASAARELSKLLDDEVLIFEDTDRGGYDYCTGHSYHHGWGQTLLEKEVIFSSYEGWY